MRIELNSEIENMATEQEREAGLDIADYLIELDYLDFLAAKGNGIRLAA
jgi:hypothetical protein